MEGIINVLKPPGMTSSDVVVWIRKVLKIKKVGHTGTLDPGVAGVLPICVGKGTRLAEFITDQGKEYIAEVTFGVSTDTQDSYGKVIEETSSPKLRKSDVEAVLPKFQGEISQIPPMFSAVRKEGKHLYEYARQGISVERALRQVTIHRLSLDKWYEGNHPKAILTIECSKGTYIRTICHDLGQALGCGAHMSYLVRVRSGPFKIQDSWTIEEIEKAFGDGNLAFLLPLSAGIDLPRATLPEFRAKAFRNGLPTKKEYVKVSGNYNASFVQVIEKGQLIGIGVWREESLYPHKVF
ncbi:tRNA pseudouridine 55 synthase [Desulfosporosinus orientis DSM 765]|uniref:tRNA pseudouridine synthase B n=1 Tax=Desulfosporosinus orientis (strain ATCC 19365 / DSM 765 / NCIMB 8382 / VKM B-1628 / Singapore I) TaxID=768706 RepID=G7WC51_DESOD|nr:tRNA pseudouridine(55) synthase TruB [Desulfosporosinus orientis]AET70025.1 tRNA pseudouridine 55 synthase [Desulfosporosinus orientis DSM 765]